MVKTESAESALPQRVVELRLPQLVMRPMTKEEIAAAEAATEQFPWREFQPKRS